MSTGTPTILRAREELNQVRLRAATIEQQLTAAEQGRLHALWELEQTRAEAQDLIAQAERIRAEAGNFQSDDDAPDRDDPTEQTDWTMTRAGPTAPYGYSNAGTMGATGDPHAGPIPLAAVHTAPRRTRRDDPAVP